ncbi:MAG: COR domain-containing protein [Lewinella sp.]
MAVLKYWDEQDRLGTTYQNEGRLMILGKGKVGKTSLLKKLQDPDCELDPDEDQTHGINIWRDWEFPVLKKKDQTFIASVWDFGGQDVQHLTHQYFLTPGTVYIVMLNKRNTNTSDEYVDLDYWFRIITALGRYPGQQARVLVVHNRFSSDGTAAGIDLAELQERYKDSLQLSLHTVNIKDEVEEMALLRGKIETALLGLPNVGKAIIKGWPVVRTALSQKRATHKRISYDDFTDLCEAEGIKSDGGQRLLLSYLVRLGEVIHYAGTGMLANYVLLDIEWITKTVYGITQNQRFIDREGRFERSEIIDIWEKQGVGRATDHNLMLELLQVNAFELCWKADKTRFLTPTLFSPQVPKDVTPVRADLGLRYSAKYLPDGLMGQLIVRLHGLAENEAWWRKGIYLYDPETKCRALVRQPIAKNHLSITVEGLSPQNYALLRLVKRELDTVIERSFSRIEFTQSIPCPCETCKRGDREQHYFSVRKLHQNRSDGKIKVHCSHENPTPIDVLIDGLKKTLGLHTDNFNQELRELIGGGELKEAVELIEHQYPGEKASLIKLAYTDLLRNQIVGTLSADERSRFRQQLAERLLSFSELLETSGGRGITSTTIEQGVSEIKAQLTSIKSTSEDTNTRLKNLQTSLNQVKQDLDQQTDALFTDRKEQRAFMNRLEEFVEALPKDKQPAPDWYDADQKKKIKVGIDLIKLLNKATGIELEGMNLKWEQELDVSGAKLPESWAAFKQWFMK